MSTDPASVNLTVAITGLSTTEAIAVLTHAPGGSTFTADVSQPALGGHRYTVRVDGLSLLGAKNLITAMHAHFEAQADPTGGQP